jgi:hypothetical protein
MREFNFNQIQSMELHLIREKIHEINGQKVILDFDLAELYGVSTKVLNQAVKRNENRFPKDFVFQLTSKDLRTMWSQIVTTSQRKRKPSDRPYAFTEHGVGMVASVLKSEKAVQMNIAIVRAFIALREFALNYKKLAEQIDDIRGSITSHDEQLNQIYTAIENLLADKASKEKWEERERIGFNSKK